MTEPVDLVDRIERLRLANAAPKTTYDTPKTPDEEPRFAGADAPAMFDVADFGGRFCDTCGTSIDGARADASHCSDACRARGWRRDQKGPAA